MTTETGLALPDEQQLKHELEAIDRFQRLVRSQLVQDLDYGVIPGTGGKPTLYKPGAEKVAKLLGLADTYSIMDKQEEWVHGFFRFVVKCTLTAVRTSTVISEGMGECNSMEAKYRWRESKRKCPECGAEAIIKGRKEYGGGWLCFKKQGGCGAKWADGTPAIEDQKVGRVANDDIYTQVNTLLKMAKKRAMVDAVLSAARLSNLFTQDLEDARPSHAEEAAEEEKATSSAPAPAEAHPTVQEPPALKTLGDLYTAGRHLGYQTKKDMLAAIGVADDTLIGADLDEAFKKLQEHRP